MILCAPVKTSWQCKHDYISTETVMLVLVKEFGEFALYSFRSRLQVLRLKINTLFLSTSFSNALQNWHGSGNVDSRRCVCDFIISRELLLASPYWNYIIHVCVYYMLHLYDGGTGTSITAVCNVIRNEEMRWIRDQSVVLRSEERWCAIVVRWGRGGRRN